MKKTDTQHTKQTLPQKASKTEQEKPNSKLKEEVPSSLFEHLKIPILRLSKVMAYEFKNKKKVADFIKQAKEGSKLALLKLVAIDKTFLGERFAMRIICDAEIAKDKIFFNELAKAVSKIPRNSPNDNLIADLEGIFLNDPSLRKRSTIKLLFEKLNENQIIGDNLSDPDYDIKMLKRHGILILPDT